MPQPSTGIAYSPSYVNLELPFFYIPASVSYLLFFFFKPFNNSVLGMHVGQGDRGAYVLAGGTDAILRYWDLCEPESSYIVCHAAHDQVGSTSYRWVILDQSLNMYLHSVELLLDTWKFYLMGLLMITFKISMCLIAKLVSTGQSLWTSQG